MRPFAALAVASGLEFVRDRKSLFYAALFPFCWLAMLLGLVALLPPSPRLDLGRFFLASGLFIVLTSVAFYGVAVPLVALRERGTLRLLSTTPVSRLTVLASHAPSRIALVLAQIGLMAVISTVAGHLPVERVGSLLLTCAAGLALLTPLGFLLGAVLPSSEAASNALSFVGIVLLAMSGLFFPLEMFPEAVREPLAVLPTGLLGEALRHDLIGMPAAHPTWLAWAACAVAGALLTPLAVTAFRWDRKEPEPSGTT